MLVESASGSSPTCPDASSSTDGLFAGPEYSSLLETNIGQLIDKQSDKSPDKVAIVSSWQHAKSTYRELRTSARTLAQCLLSHGIRPGHHLVVIAGNSLEYVELFFAIGGIGAIFSVINPALAVDEILNAVDFLDAKAVIIADRVGYRKNDKVLAALCRGEQQSRLIAQIVTATKFINDVPTLHELVERQDSSDGQADLLSNYWARSDPTDTLCIQFTSGTTGPKKAAMLSHRNYTNNAFLVGARLGFTSDEVVCNCAPLFHCYGLICGLLAPIVFGGTCVLTSDVFEAGSTLEALTQEKCTVIHAVPAMYQALLDYPSATKYAPEIKLRTGTIAGSALAREQLLRLSREFHLRDLAYAYGMTEVSGVAFLTIPPETSLLENCSSVGTAMPHTHAKVVDENLNVLPPNSAGELIVSGYLVFKGYHQMPEKTAGALIPDKDGNPWMRTGDVVSVDTAGRCHILGRVKDMIKKGGENIHPLDIETTLLSHPEVLQAAIVGVPDVQWGETVAAFLLRRPTASKTGKLTNRELTVWLRKKLAPHQVPQYFFWMGEDQGVPEAMPVNVTGKVLKTELRAVAQKRVKR